MFTFNNDKNMMRFIPLAIAFIAPFLLCAEEPTWPSATLSNSVLKMVSHTPGLPESFYRAGRFVHCAMLDNIEANAIGKCASPFAKKRNSSRRCADAKR